MGETDLNLNHLKAIISYPDKSHFKGLLSDTLNLEEIAKTGFLPKISEFR